MTVPTERFVVLTGLDGAGKTSALAELARRRPDWAVGSYEPTDWLPHPELPHYDWALETHPRKVVHDLAPDARAGFFLGMIMTHWAYWLRPRLLEGRVVVMDSYHYRFCAKERVRGIVPPYFFEALGALPDASTIFIAEIPPEVAFERKTELGAHDVDREPTRNDFIRFQHRVRGELMQVCAATGASIQRLDATPLLSQVVDDLERRIASLT